MLNSITMKFNLFFLLIPVTGILCTGNVHAQESHEMEQLIAIQYLKDRMEPFHNTQKLESFVAQHSDQPYQELRMSVLDGKSELLDKLLKAEAGQVKGPYVTDVAALIYRIISFDSSWKMRASHIILKI